MTAKIIPFPSKPRPLVDGPIPFCLPAKGIHVYDATSARCQCGEELWPEDEKPAVE